MRRALIALLGLAACGGDGGDTWPARLYLALAGGETAVQLAEEEPEPF